MNATQEEPSVVGMRVRPFWSMVLYVLLVASAGFALWAQSTPAAPVGMSRAAPWVFLVFTLGFASYRIALVSARRYSAFKAFIQIFIAVIFFMLLVMPGALRNVVADTGPGAPVDLGLALKDPNGRVRALAAEVAGFRHDSSSASTLCRLLADQEPQVRTAAHAALVRLNAGADLGATPDAWKDRFP